MRNTTLCYIEKDGKYLMLHRVKKENDLNHDKWIGVGGKFEDKESPEECVIRETFEETGLVLDEFDYRGIVTFVSNEWEEPDIPIRKTSIILRRFICILACSLFSMRVRRNAYRKFGLMFTILCGYCLPIKAPFPGAAENIPIKIWIRMIFLLTGWRLCLKI